MRWLVLLGSVVAIAVAAWALWPREQVAIAPPAASNPTPVPAPEFPVALAPIIPPSAEPSAIAEDAGPQDAGVVVHATFEQVGADGRVPGTRFFLSRDGGSATCLADMMGIAHVDVPQGSWFVRCQRDCGENYFAIIPGYEHFILPTAHSLTVSGRVVDETGAAVANALVSSDAPGVESTRSADDGTFTVMTRDPMATLTASKGDTESAPVLVSSAQPIVLELRQWSMVYFEFPNFKDEPVAILSIVRNRSHSYTIDERRMKRLPLGEHEASARAWSNGKTYTAKGHFTVTRDRRRNHVQLVLSEAAGLRVNVTDRYDQPLSSVTVFASHVNMPGLPIDAGCAVVVNDAGARCVFDIDPGATMGATDSSGRFEVTPLPAVSNMKNARSVEGDWNQVPPESEVEPMYTITLGGSWREQSPALMKLGDDPITVVAVPR